MENLTTKKCVPCSGNVPPLTPEQIKLFHDEVPAWDVVDNHHLSRAYSFADFATALAWVNRVGELADREGHHPDIYLTWGRVRVDIWTHAIDGLSESDFVLAAKIDALA